MTEVGRGEEPQLEQKTGTKRREILEQLSQNLERWEKGLARFQGTGQFEKVSRLRGYLEDFKKQAAGVLGTWDEAIERVDEEADNFWKALEEFEKNELAPLEEMVRQAGALKGVEKPEGPQIEPQANPVHNPEPEQPEPAAEVGGPAVEEEEGRRQPRGIRKRGRKPKRGEGEEELVSAEAAALIENARVLGISEKQLKQAGQNVGKLEKLIARFEREKQRKPEEPELGLQQPKPVAPAGDVIRETHVTAQPRPNIGGPKEEEEEEERVEKNKIGEFWDIVERRVSRQITDQEFRDACKQLKKHYLDLFGQAVEKEFRQEMEARRRRVEELEQEWNKIPQPEDFPSEQMSREVEWEIVTGRDSKGKPIYSKVSTTLDRKELTRRGREWGMRYDDMAATDLAELFRRVGEKREGAVRISRPYKELESLFLQGMTVGEMESRFDNGRALPYYAPRELQMAKLVEARKVFEKDVESGRNNPLLEVARKITRYFAPELSDEDLQDKAKLRQAMREHWRNFAFSAKPERERGRKTGKTRPSSEVEARDLDVKISLFLFRIAGFEHIRGRRPDCHPVSQGEAEAGAIMLDTGFRYGAFYEEERDKAGRVTAVYMGGDNHCSDRRYPTSAAWIWYELLKQCGFWEEEEISKMPLKKILGEEERPTKREVRRAIEMMVECTVNDDNASYPETEEGSLSDFRNRPWTLSGVAFDLSTDDVFRHFLKYGRPTSERKSFKDAYIYAVAGHKLTEKELDKLWLTYMPGSQWFRIDPETRKRKHVARFRHEQMVDGVKQAEERLGKPLNELSSEEREKLSASGQIMPTRFGTYIVDVILPHEGIRRKILAGHLAAKAYGYDGYLSINLRDPDNPSFMVNTLDTPERAWEERRALYDFSQDEKIKALAAKQGVIVRGCIFIKPQDGTPLKIRPKELFEAVLPAGAEKEWQPGRRIARLLEYSEHPEVFRLREGFEKKAEKLWEKMAREEMKRDGLSPEEIEQHLGSYTLRGRMEKAVAESAEMAIIKLREQGYVK